MTTFTGARRWTGWFGIVVAGLSLLGTATLVNANLFPALAASSLLFDFWLLTACLLWIRDGRGGN